MKAFKNTLSIAIVALFATSCMSLQGGAYSQGYYENDQGYYEDQYYGDARVSMQVFYNELRPHGRWIHHNAYGNVWIPRVNRNFHPYATNGYWTMTNYGNMWVSNYSWGWAPFHYGRWFFDDYYGWAWVPGFEWAPAWVSWRSGGGNYGWAPLGPRMGININIHIPVNHWTFLPSRYMYNKHMYKHYRGRGSHASIYNKTTIINNVNIYNNNNYYSGPSQKEYQRESGRTTTVRNIERRNTSGRTTVNDRTVSVYEPQSIRNASGTRNQGTANRESGRTQSSTNNRESTNSGRESTSTTRNATSSGRNRDATST